MILPQIGSFHRHWMLTGPLPAALTLIASWVNSKPPQPEGLSGFKGQVELQHPMELTLISPMVTASSLWGFQWLLWFPRSGCSESEGSLRNLRTQAAECSPADCQQLHPGFTVSTEWFTPQRAVLALRLSLSQARWSGMAQLFIQQLLGALPQVLIRSLMALLG